MISRDARSCQPPPAPGSDRRRTTAAAGVTRLLLPEQPSVRALLTAIRRHFRLRAEGTREQHRMILDTFDWRFQRRDRPLELIQRSGIQELQLRSAPGEPPLRQAVARAPAFAHELSPGPLRSELERVAAVRRLIPVVCLEERLEEYHVLDDEEKTVVRLFLEHVQACAPEQGERTVKLPRVLRVDPVLGYRKPYREMCRFLREARGLEDAPGETRLVAIEALGARPGADVGWSPAADPEEPATRVALAMLVGLLKQMRANEDGIISDSDIEHLHDFRVAVRRSRTLLRSFAGLLAGPELNGLREALQWLSKETGPSRDADVQLLALGEIVRALPEADQQALVPLMAQLETRRLEAWKHLVSVLDFPRYADALADIETFGAPGGTVACGAPVTPKIGEFAAAELARTHRRLIKRGRRLRKNAPDRDVHRVRIEGKRLRYQLEFFRGLYPAKVITPPIKILRRLQDELGAFNDASVQTEALRSLARERLAAGTASSDELVAIGCLVERLAREKQSHRRRAFERFVKLADARSRRGFEALWKRGKRG